MLTDWIYWLSTLSIDQALILFLGVWLIDVPRYALTKIAMCLWDVGSAVLNPFRHSREPRYRYTPTVSAIIPCYNEADTVEATLRSLWGSYPKLEIVVVDEGSHDGTLEVLNRFAKSHTGVKVLANRPQRLSKAPALNRAFRHSTGEVIVCIDADSHLGPQAIWEIVQPLANRPVGVVSGSVVSRNPFRNLLTWIQSLEYLNAILVGRKLDSRLGMLDIASGAFSAFPRSVLDRVGGWDVGPGEDGDVTLKIRKSGFQVVFAPNAECYTDVPITWRSLFKQRLRWDRSIVRLKLRKHVDMAYFWRPTFRPTNFFCLLDTWFFAVIRLFSIWICVGLYVYTFENHLFHVIWTTYFAYTGLGMVQAFLILFYSRDIRRDAVVCLATPFFPFYQLFLRFVRLIAMTSEFLFRSSFNDPFVPARVRVATWRW